MNSHNNMRLFIGTFVNDIISTKIYDEIKSKFLNITFGKWVEHHNLHFTYHFLGDVEAKNLDVIKSKLSEDLRLYNSKLILKGMSAFPNLRNPRVLHVKVNDEESLLTKIRKSLDSRLTSLGFITEKRVFQPHVTLQRIKSVDRIVFKKEIEKYASRQMGVISEFKVSLIASELSGKGPAYRIIE